MISRSVDPAVRYVPFALSERLTCSFEIFFLCRLFAHVYSPVFKIRLNRN